MSEPITAGMKAAVELLKMRSKYDSIPEKDDDLDYLVDKVIVALNILLPSEKQYTERGIKSIRPRIREYAEAIRVRKER